MRVTVEYHLSIPAPGETVSLWVPLPAETDYQQLLSVRHQGNYTHAGTVTEPMYGATALHARWQGPVPLRELGLVVTVEIRPRSIDLTTLTLDAEPTAEVRLFLEPTAHIPTDGIVREYADRITEGRGNAIDKVRSIYHWVIDNTYRDSSVAWCGLGDVKTMLEGGNLCGKCVDINSLFVALARAAGIPAREVYGIRVAESGWSSSLSRSGDISTAQHCKSEAYLTGAGWVPVDPADVTKVIEERRPTEEIDRVKTNLLGNSEDNWLAFNHARDFMFDPPQMGGPMNYFMYPYCEIDGVRIAPDPQRFSYRISSAMG